MEIFNFNLLVNERKMDQLLQFKRDYKEFPEGMIICGEPVDFKVVSRDGIIGISHVEYTAGPKSRVSVDGEPGIIRSRIKRNIESMLKQFEDAILEIDISWSAGVELRADRISGLSEELCRIITNNIPERGQLKKLSSDLKSIIVFPEEVRSISIKRTRDDPGARSEDAGESKDPTVKPEIIQLLIDDYDREMVAKFKQECTESWLLIVFASNMKSKSAEALEETLTFEYDSPFDKTFFYDSVQRKVFPLCVRQNTGKF